METKTTTFEKRRSLKTIAMHKQSRTLTKSKPKIRIIHIFSPEIIKTDVSNFRELVQKLTGKPEHHHHDLHHQKGLKSNHRSIESQVHDMDMSHGFFINSEVEDEEEKISSMTWNGNGGESSGGGGFLNGLGDLDGFIQELGEFSYSPKSSENEAYLMGSIY